jgi:hypothetical protein
MQELLDKQKEIIDKINKVKKKAIPHGYVINLDALENVQIYTAGKEMMSQDELLKLFFDEGVLISRGDSPAITKIDGVVQFQLAGLYNELVEVVEKIQKEMTAEPHKAS